MTEGDLKFVRTHSKWNRHTDRDMCAYCRFESDATWAPGRIIIHLIEDHGITHMPEAAASEPLPVELL